jgi:hypothetical protein
MGMLKVDNQWFVWMGAPQGKAAVQKDMTVRPPRFLGPCLTRNNQNCFTFEVYLDQNSCHYDLWKRGLDGNLS